MITLKTKKVHTCLPTGKKLFNYLASQVERGCVVKSGQQALEKSSRPEFSFPNISVTPVGCISIITSIYEALPAKHYTSCF